MTDWMDAKEKRAQRRAAKRARAMTAIEDAVVQSIMGSANGRAWMHEVLVQCHTFQQSFSPGQSDVTAFKEGQRSIGLSLLFGVIRATPLAYVEMMQEQANAGTREPVLDRRDADDERNYDAAGRWIGDGDDPDLE